MSWSSHPGEECYREDSGQWRSSRGMNQYVCPSRWDGRVPSFACSGRQCRTSFWALESSELADGDSGMIRNLANQADLVLPEYCSLNSKKGLTSKCIFRIDLCPS